MAGLAALEVFQVFLVGLVAGEEFIVRYGLHPAMSALPDLAHLQARVALVKRMKYVVPLIMVPAFVASVVLLVAAGGAPGFAWRVGGLAAFTAYLLFSLFGTVPINMKVNDWDPVQPPADWQAIVARWTRIDTLRSGAAILAFALFATALAVQIS